MIPLITAYHADGHGGTASRRRGRTPACHFAPQHL